jgi:hypothetical protein
MRIRQSSEVASSTAGAMSSISCPGAPKDARSDGVQIDCKHIGELRWAMPVEEADGLHQKNAEDFHADRGEDPLQCPNTSGHIDAP